MKHPHQKSPATIDALLRSAASDNANHGAAPYSVIAVERALRILHYLSKAPEPVRATPLARQLKINTSTCFNILRTLFASGLVDFDKASKGYALGAGVVALCKRLLEREGGVASLEPLLEDFARQHRVTVTIMRRAGETRMVALLALVSDAPLRIHMNTGQRLPLLSGAAGRIMAAYGELDPRELKKQFSLVRWERPLSFDAFISQAKEARRRGWALDEGHFLQGAVTVSVPVFDSRRRLVYACAALMFSGPRQASRVRQMAAALNGLARAMESRLDGTAGPFRTEGEARSSRRKGPVPRRKAGAHRAQAVR